MEKTEKITHVELAEELKRQNLIKKDFVVPSSALRMAGNCLQIVYRNGGNPLLSDLLKNSGICVANGSESAINLKATEVAHEQFAQKLGIHLSYYKKMLEGEKHFSLLNENVNYWMGLANKNFFIRSFIDPVNDSGICRAFLSDRFFALDNYDVFFATLEAVRDSGIKLEILDCDITDKRMYVRFVAPEIEVKSPELLKMYRNPNEGTTDTGIMSGFVLTNSEVGHGKFSISPRAVINACKNGVIWKEDSFSETHLGSKMDGSQIEWSNETFQNEKKLVISQIKDWVKQFINEDYLGKKVSKMEMQGKEQLKHPIDTVHNVCVDVRKRVPISEEKENDLLNYFTKGGCTTGFGVSQAITYFAQHNVNADDRYELEIIGADVLNNIKYYDKPVVKKEKKGVTGIINPN